MSYLVRKAIVFAMDMHADHRRNYTGEPYFVHLEEVAKKLVALDFGEDAVAAAYLHDTLEDTTTTYPDLVMGFNKRIADLVLAVTDVSKLADGKRSVRKAMDRVMLSLSADAVAQSIKLADLISNRKSIVELAKPDFAKKYMQEMELTLPLLVQGHPLLFQEAEALVQNYKRAS